MNNMILSPEFHRQLWTKITPLRLLLVPLLLTLGLSVFVIDNEYWARDVLWPAMSAYIIIVIVWGCYDAAGALREEIKGNTWDFQRMSSIGPWQMGMGKLFGATSYVWVFGITLLVIMAIAYSQIEFQISSHGYRRTGTAERINFEPVFADVYYAVVMAALTGVIANMTAFWAATINLRQRSTDHVMPFIAGMIAGIWILQSVMRQSVFVPGFNNMASKGLEDFEWWGITMDYRFFLLCLMLYAVYWLTAGIYRTMRLELGFRNTPVVWGAFCLSLVALVGGIFKWHISSDAVVALSFICLSMMGLAYMAMLSEADNLAGYRRLKVAFKSKNFSRMAENTPRWMVSAAIACAAYGLLLIWPMDDVSGQVVRTFLADKASVLGVVLSLGLLMVRDGMVVHAMLLGRARNRTRFGIIIYYLIVYALLPLFIFSVFDVNFVLNVFESGRYSDDDAFIRGVFYPGTGAAAAALPVLLMECAGAWFIMRERLRQLKAD